MKFLQRLFGQLRQATGTDPIKHVAAPKGFAATAAVPTHGHLAKWRVEAFLNQQKMAADPVAGPPT